MIGKIIGKDGVRYEEMPDEPTNDWLHPQGLRIVAPKELALQYPAIYVWFQLNDLPIEKFDTYIHLYCNEILPEHQALVDGLNGVITIETKP